MFRYVADGAEPSSVDLVRSPPDITCHGKDLLGLLIEERLIITKVLLVHVSVETAFSGQDFPPNSAPMHAG